MQRKNIKLKDDLSCGIGKNSWYLQKPLEKCKGLFENEKNDFLVHAFTCKCGDCQIYINTKKLMTHSCDKCSCSYFYSPNCFVNTSNTILVNIELKPHLEKTSHEYTASIYIDIPIDIDINRTKLLYKEKKILTLSMGFNGIKTINSKYQLTGYAQEKVEEIFAINIYNNIKTKITNHDILNFEKKSTKEKYDILSFFLQNNCIEDAEFYFWEKNSAQELMEYYKNAKTPLEALKIIAYRKEKSILRSLYHRYNYTIQLKGFDPLFPFLVCRIFNDTNIITKLLNNTSLILYHKKRSFLQGYELNKIFAFFEFLKQYYNKFELAHFIQEIAIHVELFEDIYNMYDPKNQAFSRYFSKVKISLINIHDEFITISHLNHVSSSYSFTYTKSYLKACTLENSLEYRLPYTGKELSSWSIELKNCLFSYSDKILKKQCVIYGVFRNNTLLYAIEILDGKINQALGYSNKKINQTDKNSILVWFTNYFPKYNFGPTLYKRDNK